MAEWSRFIAERRAGVQRHTVYAHFPTERELFLQFFQHRMDS